jgi:hypothetical protein
MNDENKLPLSLHPADTTPTTHLPPTSQPDTVMDNTVNHFEHRMDKAKTAYYAACYENSKGDTGPWPPVEEVVIG